MFKVWMLTKFYDCEVHGWKWPVAAAYGNLPYVPLHPPDLENGWALVHVTVTPPQIEAAKKDPRVVYCGKDYNRPPQQVLDTYKDWLDPNTTYQFMGQVIAALAEREPKFYHEVQV